MIKDAIISDCGRYRYALSRRWDYGERMLQIVMLNPSTADAHLDDPTIRRCIGFAEREDFVGILVFNLFAFRATSPVEMKNAADPVGPENDAVLIDQLHRAEAKGQPVLCAWGAHGSHLNRDIWFRRWAKETGTDLVHIGLTKAGQPKHPLYVKANQPFGVLYG